MGGRMAAMQAAAGKASTKEEEVRKVAEVDGRIKALDVPARKTGNTSSVHGAVVRLAEEEQI